MAPYIHLLTISAILIIINSSSSSSDSSDDPVVDPVVNVVERIAVANRKKGDGLLIESENEKSQISIILNEGSEPMYVVSIASTNEMYIGDRGNSQFYVYDSSTLKQIDIIPACNGIFHFFLNELAQLWTVCDIDLTILVYDTLNKQVIKTINIANITDSGYKPHDITTKADYAFVSLINPGSDGIIIQYSTNTLTEINRINVGGDPHLFLDPFDDNPCCLYVAAQDNGMVYQIDIDTLEIQHTLNINGAHGIWGNKDYLYVADITSSGPDSLYVINLDNFDNVAKFDSTIGSAHNLMLNVANNKLFVTHSAAGAVTVYDIESDGGLKNQRTIFEEDGSVPFGIMCIDDLRK